MDNLYGYFNLTPYSRVLPKMMRRFGLFYVLFFMTKLLKYKSQVHSFTTTEHSSIELNTSAPTFNFTLFDNLCESLVFDCSETSYISSRKEGKLKVGALLH